MHSVTDLPFNRLVGIESSSTPSEILKLPAGPQYLNHVGTVHASALLALAEAASGEFLLRELGSSTNLLPVVRRLEAKFRRPANGSIRANLRSSTISDLQTAIENKGRAFVTVTIDLFDAIDEHVLEATVEWFVAKASR